MPGLRLHGLLGSAALSHGAQSTHFLRAKPATIPHLPPVQPAHIGGKVRPREQSSPLVCARRTRVTPPQQPSPQQPPPQQPPQKSNLQSHLVASDDTTSELSLVAAVAGDDLVAQDNAAHGRTRVPATSPQSSWHRSKPQHCVGGWHRQLPQETYAPASVPDALLYPWRFKATRLLTSPRTAPQHRVGGETPPLFQSSTRSAHPQQGGRTCSQWTNKMRP
jgi:hypothetical protein